MPAPHPGLILRRLSRGENSPLLVADFQPFSAAPRISALLSAGDHGLPVFQIDPIAALSRDTLYFALSEMAVAAAREFKSCMPSDGRIFVAGHCSAAALSLHVARLLEGAHEVIAILVQPSWPGESAVTAEFARLLADMGADSLACPDLDGDPSLTVARLEEALHGALATVAATQGLDGSTGPFAELLVRYRAWLAFLLACRNDHPARGAAPASVRIVADAAADSTAIPWPELAECEVSPLPVLGRAYSSADLAASIIAATGSS